MTDGPGFLRRRGLLVLLAIFATVAACGERPNGMTGIEVRADKGGNGKGGGPPGTESSNDEPTVESTEPASAPQDTTLEVTVFGSDFDEGSTVEFLLDEESTDRIVTNSTRFEDSETLVANITIAVNAIPDLYDVAVTTSKGKRGIGIELFEVQPAFKITFSSVGSTDSEVLTTSTCGPGYLLARMKNDDPFSLRVDGTSREEFEGDFPFLVEFSRVDVAWTRVYDVGKGTTGNFGTDSTEEDDSPCYGETEFDQLLVGNLLLDIHEGRGKPSERRQHVHFHLVFDPFCIPSDDPNPGSCSTLEDFILSEGSGELAVVGADPRPFGPDGSGSAVVEGMMEFEYFRTDLGDRVPIDNGGPMLFRFRIDIERIDASTL